MYNSSYTEATNRRLDEIIDQLNALEREHDDLGPISLDMALDYRADEWEGAYEDYPEPTPEEIEAMRVDAERNESRLEEIESQRVALIDEYVTATGLAPHLYSVSGTWDRSTRERTLCAISLDNGHTYVTPEEVASSPYWDAIVNAMDDEIREAVHYNIAPCSNAEFLREYLLQASEDLIIG